MKTLALFVPLAAVVVTVVMLAAPRMVEPATASAFVAAVLICAATGLVALIPAALVAPRHPTYLMEAGMAAILLRLFLTIGAAAAYWQWWLPQKWPFLNAMVVFYLLFLAGDTFIIIRLARRYWRTPAKG
jgi:hypothetical protein